MTSADAIARLQIWYTKINKNRPTNISQNTMALQTTISKQKERSQLVCTNPNCRCQGHTIEICYWPGGGKEGQFPPGFGKRGGLRGMAFSTRQGGFKPEIKAHITTTDTPNEENEQVFAYMLTDQKDFKVLATPTFSTSTPHDNPNSRRYNETTIQEGALKGVQVANIWSEDDPIVFRTQSANTPDILTFIDSGATDHCFADRSLFVSYNTLSKPSFGMSAGKDSTFDIIGKGKVEFQTSVDGKTRTVSIKGVLHTPNLRSNLISVSQLGTKGVDVFFKGGNKALVLTPKGEIIMTATKIGRLYAVDVNRALMEIFITQSKRQAVSFDTWHRRLGHAGAESICNMISGKLVDELMTQGELSMNGLCENCIFGKHATHPFNWNWITRNRAPRKNPHRHLGTITNSIG